VITHAEPLTGPRRPGGRTLPLAPGALIGREAPLAPPLPPHPRPRAALRTRGAEGAAPEGALGRHGAVWGALLGGSPGLLPGLPPESRAMLGGSRARGSRAWRLPWEPGERPQLRPGQPGQRR